MQLLEEKYIELLLRKCLNFKKSKSLLISYDKVNSNFVEKIVEMARKMGIEDIYLDEEDIFLTHQLLSTLSLEEIENSRYFNKSKWNEYAIKDASFLTLDTEFPGVMDDIDPEKIAKSAYVKRNTKGIYKKKQITYQIPWCFAALPNEIWARNLFPNDENAYNKLFGYICHTCMVNDKNPILNWEEYLQTMDKRIQELNSLGIESLHYTNGVGTDLTIGMNKDYKWSGMSENQKLDMIVNMPSYEIFTNPDYRKTNGIVYSTMPLVYNSGLINDFYLVFKDGRVIDFDAKQGKDILKGIILSDEQSRYLGEVALVEYNSPISNCHTVFGTTLLDENASCHLALGNGIEECVKGTANLSSKELLNLGVNQSGVHVDFMIGSKDLQIEAETKHGKKLIFKNGNFYKK